jgi:hypothetical protein
MYVRYPDSSASLRASLELQLGIEPSRQRLRDSSAGGPWPGTLGTQLAPFRVGQFARTAVQAQRMGNAMVDTRA